jgi:DNA-binding phage protein
MALKPMSAHEAHSSLAARNSALQSHARLSRNLTSSSWTKLRVSPHEFYLYIHLFHSETNTRPGALDAESETLVNQALSKLLEERNTTISIAHRLSTIKRSDRIICLSADGQVAEEGTYQELANNPNGAFNKLMEWQLSGGDAAPQIQDPRLKEEEEIEHNLEMEDDEVDETNPSKQGS